MRVHINVLYGITFVLLILQAISFLVMSSHTAKIISEQDQLADKFQSSINDIKQQNTYNTNELISLISTQREDFENEIQTLRTSQANGQDFSEIIEETIKGVISIKTDKSIGTGFIISEDGYAITNYHVISDGIYIQGHTYDEKEHEATLIGYDQLSDIALIKIEANWLEGERFNALEFDNSDNVQIGEQVIAIGNPLGLSFTVTEGIVSSVDRQGPNGLADYIQTDVTLNPGNSGGPLINRAGKVIGVNNFKIGGAESLGFALESNIAKEKIESFKQI